MEAKRKKSYREKFKLAAHMSQALPNFSVYKRLQREEQLPSQLPARTELVLASVHDQTWAEFLTLAPGSDRIPAELFQILKDDAVESAALNMSRLSAWALGCTGFSSFCTWAQ